MIPIKKSKEEVLISEADNDFKLNKFNHDNMFSDTAACGFDANLFKEKNGTIQSIMETMDDDKNFVSQLAEGFEKQFTSREITYMAAKMAYVNMVVEFEARGVNRAIPAEDKEGVPVPESKPAPAPMGTETQK